MKKSVILLTLLFLINFVSAQFFSGYGRFSVTDFFDRIDPQTMIIGAIFLIAFALIYYSLSRVFKDSYGQPNKAIAAPIAFSVSALIVYGIYKYGFDFEGIFYDIGISSDLLYTILPIIFFILAILIIWKLKIRGFLILLGLLLILLTIFTEIFYEKGLTFLIGLILLIAGLLLWGRARRGVGTAGRGALKAGRYIGSKYDWEREKREARAIGRGVRGVGRGARWAYRKGKEYREHRDPRYRLARHQEKREIAEEKELARRRLAEERRQGEEEKSLARRRLKEEARRR